jgi:hypothetical protein
MCNLFIRHFIIFIAIGNLHAQNITVPPIIHSQTTLSRLTRAGGFNGSEIMRGIPPPSGEVIGSPYIDDEWHIGTVLLYQGDALIERHPLKYDLEKQLLEIYDGSIVKILECSKVKSFIWVNDASQQAHYFVNAQDFNLDGSSLIGFFEVLVDGSMPLLKKTEVTLQKANYVKEFDTGSRDDKLVKNEYLYYAEQKMVTRVPKRKLSMIFKTYSAEIDNFINKQNLNAREVEDQVVVFKKYNSLVAQGG